jgi:hypothetical protein
MFRWWVSSGVYITLYITKIFTSDLHVSVDIFLIALHKFHVSEALFFTMDLLQTLILQLYSGTAQLLVKNTFSSVVQVWFLYEKKDTFLL